MMAAIRELGRRVRMATAYGVTTSSITISDDGMPQVQVRLSTLENPTLRIVEQDGFGSQLPLGTPITASFAGGDRSNGVVTGSSHSTVRPAMADGDKAMFAHGFSVIIEADGIHLNGPVWVNGALVATGEVTAQKGSASVSLSTHKGHEASGGPPTPGT